MEVSLALLADAANTTATQKLNVLGVFGNINPPGLPYRHPSMTLVLKFDADPVEVGTEKSIHIVLVDPDGREINRLEMTTTIPEPREPGQPIEMALQVGLNGLRFERSGPHAFVVIVNGETKRRVPLTVTPRPQEPAPPGD
ncbi:MAG: hypothetical protein IH609_04320 [Dehalococcoidia bacterium]|nr:hypothetical protein [Dehalococcoidia bacterium]